MGLSDDEDGSGSQLSWDPSARRSRTRLFSRRRLNRNNEDRDKETTVLDPLIDFKEPEDRVGPQPVARFDQDLPTVSPPCRVALVNVSGLNGLEAGFDYDNLAHLTSVEALRKTIATALDIDKISFRFRDDRILGETATKDAIGSLAVELLDHVARSVNFTTEDEEQPEDIVVIFVARDLGGSVLKQALLEASQNSKYLHVLQRTALLVFAGTPQRCGQDCSWTHMLSKLFYERSTALDGPWLPQQLQHLSAFHEDLTVKFRTLLETGDFELLSIYQEPPGLATYELLVPEAAATLSQPREVRIGLHRSYQSLAEFRDLITQTAFANKVQDVRSKRQPEYQLFIKLLSNHGLSIPARHYNYSRPAFRNFCDWLLLDSAFAPWVDTEFSLELLPEDSVERAGTLIAKNVMVLEVGEAINDTAILAGSLVASMRSKRALAVDHFITLAHHHPQALTLTKPQLMASLCHQILTHSPRLLNHIGQWLKLAREALQSHNFHWKEAVLWQILKRLFSSKSLRHVCIIIHQPPEAKFSRPFLDLLTDVDSLLETTNIHCKILVVRAISSSKGPPQRWPVLQKVISHGDEGARAALEMDFTEEWRIHSHSGPDPTALRARAVSVLLRDGLELGKARLLANLIAKHTLLSLELLVNTSLGWETDDGLASLISDLIPKTFRAWVGTGLLWMTHAARPLTRIELEAALSLAFDSCRNSTAAPLPLCLVDIFADFLCGLVEVDATGVVFSTCPYICGRVLTHIRLGQDEPKLFLETQPNIGAPDGQAELALHCLRYLSQDGDSMEQPAAPLCRYAVEHWLSHLNLSEDTTVIASVMADFVLSDQDRAGRWIQQRALYWASHDAVAWRELEASNLAPPSLEELVSEFSYQSAHGSTGMMEIIDLAFEASALRTVRGRQMWHALALAAAQTGKLDALRVLDGRGHLDGDGILDAIYESGSRDALRGLVQIKPAWVRKNIHKLVQHAVRSGDLDLVESLQYEFGPSFSSANYEPPLIHDLAANGQIVPSDRLWEGLKSGVEYQSPAGQTILHVAASSGHVDLLAKLLVAISEPALRINHHDALGLTALHLGTARGHVGAVEQLLAAGAQVDPPDKFGQTPLHMASAGGYVETVRALIGRGASIGFRDDEGKTPLHLALEDSHLDVSIVLLDKLVSCPEQRRSVDLDAAAKGSLTPLTLAVRNSLLPAVRSLLRLGAGVNTANTNQDNITPLHAAVKHGSYEVVEELLGAEGIEVNARDDQNITPLHLAAELDRPRVIRSLLDKGADASVQDWRGLTPLSVACLPGNASAVKMLLPSVPRDQLGLPYYWASRSGNEEVLGLVLDAGVDKNSKWSIDGAIHHASFCSEPRLLRLLLVRRVDLEVRDNNGATALMRAVEQDARECVKLLVDAGASVSSEDGKGHTVWFRAASMNRLECFRILLRSCYSMEFKVPTGKSVSYETVVDMALAEFKPEIFRMLVDHLSTLSPQFSLSPSPDMVVRLVSQDCDVENIRTLLEKASHWDPNEEVGRRGTMLHYAAYFGRLHLTEVLIQSDRVDVNKRNDEYGTPLETAVREPDSPSCIEIVQKLLDKGALTSIGSSYFGSPLHAAAATPNYIWMDGVEDRYLTMARYILQRDPAAINLTAGYFGTPLAAALDRGTEAMITELLNHSPSLVIIASIVGTVLHALARRKEAVGGLVPTLEMLLDRAAPGVTPATPDAVGRLPIHLAAVADNEAFISLLTTPEVTLLSRAVGGRHALHFAAGSGSMSVAAELLVRHPEAIDDVDDDGWTPLHWACRQDSVPMVELLLENGADKHRKTKRGWQPIDVAMYHGFHDDIVELVRVSPETPEKPPPPLLAGEQERSPPNAAALAMTGEYLSYHCDNCVLDIYGPRYCCTCHGLDLCFKCFRLTSQHLFTGHHFELFDMLGNRLSAAGEEDTDGH